MPHQLHDQIYRINCLTEDTDSIYHQAALKFGVSDSVLFVLYMLYTHEERCQLYDIYKLSGISKQTINSAIRKLEHDEIVYLEKLNGKSKLVRLTEKGRAYASQTAARLYQAECSAFDDWSAEEITTYLDLLEKHNDSLRRQVNLL